MPPRTPFKVFQGRITDTRIQRISVREARKVCHQYGAGDDVADELARHCMLFIEWQVMVGIFNRCSAKYLRSAPENFQVNSLYIIF